MRSDRAASISPVSQGWARSRTASRQAAKLRRGEIRSPSAATSTALWGLPAQVMVSTSSGRNHST